MIICKNSSLTICRQWLYTTSLPVTKKITHVDGRLTVTVKMGANSRAKMSTAVTHISSIPKDLVNLSFYENFLIQRVISAGKYFIVIVLRSEKVFIFRNIFFTRRQIFATTGTGWNILTNKVGI